MYRRRSCRHGGFTLVELLVVIGVIALVMGMLMPALGRARSAANTVKCLSNIRNLAIAQSMYAADQKNYLVYAGNGSEQGSWIGLLQKYSSRPLVRMCPSDNSAFYEQPLPGTSPPRFRTTSYGINNYVSPTHAPFGRTPPNKVSQVLKSGKKVIQFVELAESGTYAGADHVHVQDFFLLFAPTITYQLIDKQMPLGRHGGAAKSGEARLNFSFLDGHAETMSIQAVYKDPKINLFDPLAVQ